MGSIVMKHLLLALAAAALVAAIGCKSDHSFEKHQKTAGEEVELREEHGDTAIDEAAEGDDFDQESSGEPSGDE